MYQQDNSDSDQSDTPKPRRQMPPQNQNQPFKLSAKTKKSEVAQISLANTSLEEVNLKISQNIKKLAQSNIKLGNQINNYRNELQRYIPTIQSGTKQQDPKVQEKLDNGDIEATMV